MMHFGDGYLTMKWLHVIAAAIVVGLLAVFPTLRLEAQRSGEMPVVRYILRFLNRCVNLFLLPSIVLLFVTGILMVVGPWAAWDMFSGRGQWLLIGFVLWVAMSGLILGWVGGIIKRMIPIVEREGPTADRLAGLWLQYRWGVLAGALVTVSTVWVMVFKPGW